MRISWTVLSLGLLAEALGGCGGESYRLGSNTEIDPTGGAGVTGQGGDGQGGSSAGSGGVGDRLAPLPDGGLAPPSSPPLIQDSTWIVSSELGVLHLATDEQHLYFNESGGPIWRTDHAGISVEKLVETQSYHMGADATHVYWTTNTDIRRVPKTGGATEIIAVLSGAPTSFGWMTLDDFERVLLDVRRRNAGARGENRWAVRGSRHRKRQDGRFRGDPKHPVLGRVFQLGSRSPFRSDDERRPAILSDRRSSAAACGR